MPPPRFNPKVHDEHRIPPPKNLFDVPRYLKAMYKGISQRMFYIVKLVWEANPFILFVLSFMTLFNGIMPVIGSLISKEILNNLARTYTQELTEFDIISSLLIMQFIYLLLRSAIDRAYATISRISGEIISNHIKLKLMGKAKQIDLSSYDNPDYYAKLENANREASVRPMEALNSTFSIISTLISIISYIIVMLAVGIIPAIMIMIVAVPSTIINFYFRKRNFNFMFRRSKERRQMQYFSEILVNKDLVKEIRVLGLSDEFIGKFKSVYSVYFKELKKLIISECYWNIGASLLSNIVNCVLFVYIAKGVFAGDYEVGNYALYTGALTAISGGISSLINTTASIYECTLFINNMIAFMDEEVKIVPSISPARMVQKGDEHTIVFENVSFRYEGAEVDVLKNVNLLIEPQSSIVIVGLNGAGKTTLIKLLMRVYDPTEGRILLDGHDIKEYDVISLYNMFGVVFQDYGKYAVSVKENISFGAISKELDMDSITTSAIHSNCEDYIDALPLKYETPLTKYFEDTGTELSIGQWQKLAIARAFYSDSDVLILDEPTAALDPMAEQEIFNQFDNLRKGKTSIFVSHRLSSATSATKIIVMNYGEIIETGTHNELMSSKGEYYKLFSTQAKRYNETMSELDNDDYSEQDNHGQPPHGRPPHDGGRPPHGRPHHEKPKDNKDENPKDEPSK